MNSSLIEKDLKLMFVEKLFDNFLNKIGKKLSKSFSTNIRLRSFSIKDEFINAAQIKLGEDDDG